MAVLWPILLVASAAMTTISYRKKKTGKADKDYYSVRGWGCLAFMSLLGVMMSYLPLGILSVGGCFFIAAFVLMYFAYSKKEHKLKVQKATAWLLLALSFVTVGVGSVAAEEYSPRTKVVVKYTGAKEYQQVKEKNAALISAKKVALLAYAPLAKKVKKLEAQEKAEKEAAAKAKREQEKQAAAASSASDSNTDDSADTSSEQHGDMNTADSQKIVGNVNSKIYHVPGQSGYRMNSSNAVYFNSEEEAQRAGYRRAKR
ncbi:sunset domain-containing protein [Lactobacillus delbrueckii subsp. bulgaricus]|nr:hypothetical protein [Lactobacillus delbrueckii subsp. bulgaricus]MBT8819847.1 hypothetical protein [Lactobacillus delbrueckii subsp. bulgaricus]MBT8835636.1 hypothetical protein [Lactobacillus delbrueckii subsp. bulgaricus]MBT8883193.1 hypothetical protein [Lactobacillus delbrueckii subsp. bulgaricus]MBT8886288.1 hypothetical protein [Lactobacillus delbrueckii subsp. bulgaricus]